MSWAPSADTSLHHHSTGSPSSKESSSGTDAVGPIRVGQVEAKLTAVEEGEKNDFVLKMNQTIAPIADITLFTARCATVVRDRCTSPDLPRA